MSDDYFADGGGYQFGMRNVLLGGLLTERFDVIDRWWHVAQEVNGRRWEGIGRSRAAAVLDLIAQRAESFPPHRPHRGSDVESWLKRKRDSYDYDPDGMQFAVLDDLLDDYRLHADTGVPLGDEVTGPTDD